MNLDIFTNELYRSIADDDKPRKMEHWHASSIAKCPRAQYFMRQGVQSIQKPGAGKVLRWQAGHEFESVIRPHLKKLMPMLMSNQRMTKDQLDLTGEFDNYDPDTKTLWEIKTVSSHAVRYRRKDDTRHHLRDNQQYLHHEWQQHAYVLLMEDMLDVEHIGYLYITLDGLIVPYYTDVKPVMLNEVLDRVRSLNEAWQKQEAPECLCSDESSPFYNVEYRWCPYKTEWGCCDLRTQESLPLGKEQART